MANFKYRAKQAGGGTVTGTIQAESREAAFSQLVQKRLVVLNLQESKAGKPFDWSSLNLGSKSVKADTLVFFTYQLSAMLRAGLPIVRCLSVLEEEMSEPYFRKVLKEVRESLEGGDAFSEALGKFPNVFNKLYINLTAAGEMSGNLDEVLHRLAQYMDNMARLMRKIKSALAYPAVLVVVTIAVMSLMMIKVIPVFEEVYGEAGVKLPAMTQLCIDISRFMRENMFLLFGGMALFVVANTTFYKTKPGRRFFHALALRIPIIGTLIQKNLLARCGRTLGVLVSSGMPMLAGLKLVEQAAGNVFLEEAIEFCSNQIEQGETLSTAMKQTGQFSSMFVQMVSAGEETGKLPEMLSNVADFYENEVNLMADTLATLLEPIFIVFVGASIGVIVVAMYLPIFQMGSVV